MSDIPWGSSCDSSNTPWPAHGQPLHIVFESVPLHSVKPYWDACLPWKTFCHDLHRELAHGKCEVDSIFFFPAPREIILKSVCGRSWRKLYQMFSSVSNRMMYRVTNSVSPWNTKRFGFVIFPCSLWTYNALRQLVTGRWFFSWYFQDVFHLLSSCFHLWYLGFYFC